MIPALWLARLGHIARWFIILVAIGLVGYLLVALIAVVIGR